jgi:hypothetical protein
MPAAALVGFLGTSASGARSIAVCGALRSTRATGFVDFAARAAGFVVSRLDGGAQAYNCPDPRNGQIAVVRPSLHAQVLAQLAALGMR